ncbi:MULTISPECIES: DUF2345 domain-containing protein [unclassified Janthinobacterium]|uniref:DUF2345 domain-containing protein n=1 Tax=unclassified Janthinobacterium TaxID=2610881 RepID=UPI00034B4C0A|nr:MULTISPECIES: DUF2345 domain-containing protein [unclassified Janthinobacterium]MEC5162797.1 hypothetical protein [Janthinobacterium sp. CG_S6]
MPAIALANSVEVLKGMDGGGGHTPVTAYTAAQLQLSSPAGIGATTPANAILAAGNTGSVTAGQDINFAAQGNSYYLVKAGVSLFTYGKAGNKDKPNQETGIKLHAATGKVSSQSQSDKTSITADKSGRSAFIDGKFGKTGRAGYGGIKRVMLTVSENYKGGMKMQIIGTVIDFIGDANTVYVDEKGSGDLSEFFGRAGVSLAKAGATATIGSVIAAVFVGTATIIVGTAGLPVFFAVAVVVGGYILAATIVDKIDSAFDIKNSVAEWAR